MLTLPQPNTYTEDEQRLGGHIDLLAGACSVIASHANLLPDFGAGLCLAATASLSWYAKTTVGLDLVAANGLYAGQPHWWAVYADTNLDPTRGQFDTLSLITAASNPLYEVTKTRQANWTTKDMVVREAQCAFLYPDFAALWAHNVLRELLSLPTVG